MLLQAHSLMRCMKDLSGRLARALANVPFRRAKAGGPEGSTTLRILPISVYSFLPEARTGTLTLMPTIRACANS